MKYTYMISMTVRHIPLQPQRLGTKYRKPWNDEFLLLAVNQVHCHNLQGFQATSLAPGLCKPKPSFLLLLVRLRLVVPVVVA